MEVSCVSNQRLCDSTNQSMGDLRRRLLKKQLLLQKKDLIIKRLRQKCKKCEKKLNEANEKLDKSQEILKSMFSAAQIRILEGKYNEYVHWAEEDICQGVSLYSISKRAYFHLRDRMNYPLPSEPTLKRWLQKIDIKPGELIIPVMSLLGSEFAGRPEVERICVLSLDEMKIDDQYCYDPKEDQVLGGNKNACVITIRGLFNKWKQIVHYDWEKMPTKDDILNIISALYDVGLDVRGHISDMGPKTQRLWRDFELGLVSKGEINKTWYLHPRTQKKIFVFPDYPHLLKLLRNHVMDSGVYFPDGSILNKQLYIDLLSKQKAEFSLTSKLSHKHLYLTGKQRQSVGTAYQAFDHTVSKAVRLLLPGKVTQANFIDVVNDTTQITNVRTSFENLDPAKCPYGMKIKEQNEILDAMFWAFREVTIGHRKKRTYAPFQKGFLVYITSLKELYGSLKDEFNIDYIIPARLNQDHLENIFSQVRGLGGFNCSPTALDFKYRIKKLICSQALLTPQSASVCRHDDDCEMVSSRLFSHLISQEQINLEPVKTRPKPAGLLSDNVVDNLTDINWNIETHKLMLEDCSSTQRSELGGMEYVAGYAAMKLKETHPHMAAENTEDVEGFWVNFLNNGVNNGLVQPSDEWFSTFRKWEEIFVPIHGEGKGKVLKSPGAVRQLRSILISNFQHVPEDVINYYAKLRILVRIKYLNKCLDDEKFIIQERKRLARLNGSSNGEAYDEPEPHAEALESNEVDDLEVLEKDLEMIEELLASLSARN